MKEKRLNSSLTGIKANLLLKLEKIRVTIMEIKTVVNNGVQIPNECICIWCGSKMHRGGANRMGAGVNSFSLWCSNCGVVVIHACDFGKKITGYEVKWDVE